MKLPNFYYENKLWKKGSKFVAGLDEVGRGSFAGPVVTAAVAFAPQTESLKLKAKCDGIIINDSKKLSANRREVADKWIKENAVTWGIGEASVSEINRFGISKATHSAFRRAVGGANIRLHNRIDFLLIDAFYIPYIRGYPMGKRKVVMGRVRRKNKEIKKLRNEKRNNLSTNKLKDKDDAGGIIRNDSRQLAIINGDSKSFSIAAASIIAKVYRDKLMLDLSKRKRNRNYGWESNKGYGTKEHRDSILKIGTTRHHRKQFVESFLNRYEL